ADQHRTGEDTDGAGQEMEVLGAGAGGGASVGGSLAAEVQRAELVGALVGHEEKIAVGHLPDGEPARAREVAGGDDGGARGAGKRCGQREEQEAARHGHFPRFARSDTCVGLSYGTSTRETRQLPKTLTASRALVSPACGGSWAM